MRLRNLLEYDDLNPRERSNISKIAGLQAENDEDVALLDRIYKLLNSGNISQSIGNAFQAPLANESLSDNEKRLTCKT